MSWCDGCQEERFDVEHVTAYIDYNLGPIGYGLCKKCRDSEVVVDPPIPAMLMIRGM